MLNKVGYERSGETVEFIEKIVDLKSQEYANKINQELSALLDIIKLFKINECILVRLYKPNFI